MFLSLYKKLRTPIYGDVEIPRLRTKVSDRLIDLNVKTIRSELAKVSVDMDLIEDLAAISIEDADDIEDVIREGFQSRIRSKYSSAGGVIGDDELTSLSNAYMQMLRRMKTLHKVRFEYDKTMYRLRGLEALSPEAPAAAVTGEPTGITGILDDLETRIASGATEAPVYNLDDVIEAAARNIAELEGLAETAETIAGSTTSRYTRIGDMFRRFVSGSGGELSAMFSANKGKIAAGAAAAGLAVFALKSRKDTTAEELSGPPLLPGGNPYENLPQAASQLPQSPVAPGGSGTSYNVSINASQDEIEEFMARAGYLSNGQIQGTMHDSLPNLGRNPYDDIAGSF